MRKITLLLLLVVLFKSSVAQGTWQGAGSFISFSFGGGPMFINNNAFNNWTRANYHLTENDNLSGEFGFNLVLKRYDLGLNLSVASHLYTIAGYVGRRLTKPDSRIASYLNFEFGSIGARYNNIAPLNYVPSPDQLGQQLELHYDAAYVGLISKNYLQDLRFKIGGQLFVKSGFYVDVKYQPWTQDWRYGYNMDTTVQDTDENGVPYTSTGSNFVGNKVYGIPKLANKYMDAGVFIEICIGTATKK